MVVYVVKMSQISSWDLLMSLVPVSERASRKVCDW